MFDKLLSAFTQSIFAKVAWLGGSLAAITAILSACGFLVIRAHQNLLGILGLIPIHPESWAAEGARFVYNSLLYLVAGLFSSSWVILLILLSVLFPVIMANARWAAKIQAKTEYFIVKTVIFFLSFVGLLVIIAVFLKYESVSNLLVVHQTFDNELVIRGHEKGIEDLRLQYAMLASLLVFLFVWLKLLPQLLHIQFGKTSNYSTEEETKKSSQFSRWHLGLLILWFFFLIPLFYLPMNYGKMVKSNTYFNVRLIQNSDESSSHYEGWLLHKDSNEIVVYTGTPAIEPIHIFQRGDVARIEIVGFGNIFSER